MLNFLRKVTVEDTLEIKQKADEAYKEALLKRHGCTMECPWCRQIMQGYEATECTDTDDGSIEFKCGNCEGTSLWLFTIGFTLLKPLNPPIPEGKDSYDESN